MKKNLEEGEKDKRKYPIELIGPILLAMVCLIEVKLGILTRPQAGVPIVFVSALGLFGYYTCHRTPPSS